MYINKSSLHFKGHDNHETAFRPIYVFNPDHDMALANYTWYYKSSKDIEQMSDDLSFLPIWYSLPGSKVRIRDLSKLNAFTGQTSHFIRFTEDCFTAGFDTNCVCPWGWNPALLHKIKTDSAVGSVVNGYVSNPDLFADVNLDRIRYLSSRQRCAEILSSMPGPDLVSGSSGVNNDVSRTEALCGESFSAYSLDEAVLKAKSICRDVIFKSPWSGSGRGLLRLTESELCNIDPNSKGWISRIIKNQGCIMVEPLYDKVCDFAMEFFSDADGSVKFCGYSLFETDSHGNYKQNILMSDDAIESVITRYIGYDILSYVKDRLVASLEKAIDGDYVGFLGVDMMVCKEGGRHRYKIHPCVEINLRMNMGVVSRIFFDRYVDPGSEGRFIIECFHNNGDAERQHYELFNTHPLMLNAEGKILSGYLTLTPVVNTTKYQIYVVI